MTTKKGQTASAATTGEQVQLPEPDDQGTQSTPETKAEEEKSAAETPDKSKDSAKSKEPDEPSQPQQYYATLKRGVTFDVGGTVFKVDEEREVSESLYSRLSNNVLFSVRED